MERVETNTFSILNLEELQSSYRVYKIKGLSRDHDEFFLNKDVIARKLSYALETPATVIERQGQPYLVVRSDASAPPPTLQVVRAIVRFEKMPGEFPLDYTDLSPENDLIRRNFLRFALQTPLRQRNDLWLPQSGGPLFQKQSSNYGAVNLHRGFNVRVVTTPDGLGLCVDVRSKFVSLRPLPATLGFDEFTAWKGRHAIYHYGNDWFEVRLDSLADMQTGEYPINDEGKIVNLYDYLMRHCRRPFPPELAGLDENANVVIYMNKKGDTRSAPTTLCYPVLSTDNRNVSRLQRKIALPPRERRSFIRMFTDKYLRGLKLGGIELQLGTDPIIARPRYFAFPKFEFGHQTILSVSGAADAINVTPENLGATRLRLLKDPKVGLYDQRPLYRQYYLMPETVFNSYGPRLIQDLKQAVRELHPNGGYEPEIIPYSDRGLKTPGTQGRAILKAFHDQVREPGSLLVMIHRTSGRVRTDDALAAVVTRSLIDEGWPTATMHVDSSQDCYELRGQGNTGLAYEPKPSEVKRLNGYLRNVALNKILLLNHNYPFILASRVHADLTIGLDVKNNTVGLVAVSERGAKVHYDWKVSNQQEQLLEEQSYKYILELIRNVANNTAVPAKTLVLHRDGRCFASERAGIKRAFEQLRAEGVINPDATLTIVEISKSSPASLRLIEVILEKGKPPIVQNPEMGLYYPVDVSEAYLCTTGWPMFGDEFGTVRPLHLHVVEGPLSLEACSEDVFAYSMLAWTRPEGCTRYPITIKLCDRILQDYAGEFNEDDLEFDGIFDEVEDVTS
jgi:hypothetical protein